MIHSSSDASKRIKVLVCGGAGYIGAHVVHELLLQNHPSDSHSHSHSLLSSPMDTYDVVVLDNLSTGHRETLPTMVPFEQVDLLDFNKLTDVFERHRPEAVFHLCASISVSESCEDPLPYYQNNVIGTLNLLTVMKMYQVKNFVFSSTAAVYGDGPSVVDTSPRRSPTPTPSPKLPTFTETSPLHPTSPYGETKRIIEECLVACGKAYGMKSVSLRYFNACGAALGSGLGELHPHESHLIPKLMQVALHQQPSLSVFGHTYPTPDGTCVRDYIHVMDLATVHVLALHHLLRSHREEEHPPQDQDQDEDPGSSGSTLTETQKKKNNHPHPHLPMEVWNVGSGQGYSVLDLVKCAREVTQHPIPIEWGPQRAGDPPCLVACVDKLKHLTHWSPRYTLRDILESAWTFHQTFPHGYTDSFVHQRIHAQRNAMYFHPTTTIQPPYDEGGNTVLLRPSSSSSSSSSSSTLHPWTPPPSTLKIDSTFICTEKPTVEESVVLEALQGLQLQPCKKGVMVNDMTMTSLSMTTTTTTTPSEEQKRSPSLSTLVPTPAPLSSSSSSSSQEIEIKEEEEEEKKKRKKECSCLPPQPVIFVPPSSPPVLQHQDRRRSRDVSGFQR